MWVSALCTLALIYLSLGWARVAVEWLRDRNALRLSVLLLLLIVAVMILRSLLRRRPGRHTLVVIVVFVVVYGVLLVFMERVEERLHLVEYGLVGAFIYRALAERRLHGKLQRISPAVAAVLLTAAFGWIDEGIQAVLPSRVYDLRDVAFNAVAGLLTVSAMVALSWAERRDAASGG